MIMIIVLLYIERKQIGHDSNLNWYFISKRVKIPQVLSVFLFHVISKQLLCHLCRPFLSFVNPCLQLFFWCLARSTKQTWKSRFCFFTDGKQHKARKLDMITLKNHAPRAHDFALWSILMAVSLILVISFSFTARRSLKSSTLFGEKLNHLWLQGLQLKMQHEGKHHKAFR